MKPTLLLATIGLALGGGIGYHAIYAPKQEQARVTAAHIQQVQADQAARLEVGELLEKVEQYHKRLPPEPDPSWLVREVVALGRSTGVDLTTITQQTPMADKTAEFTRLAIGLQFTTTYHQLGEFLDAVERAEPFLRVDRLNVSTTREGDAATVDLTVSTVYLPKVMPGAPRQAAAR